MTKCLEVFEHILCDKEFSSILFSLSRKFSLEEYTFIFPRYISPFSVMFFLLKLIGILLLTVCIIFTKTKVWLLLLPKSSHQPHQFMIPPNQKYLQLPHLPSLQALPAKPKSEHEFHTIWLLNTWKKPSKSRPDSARDVSINRVLIHFSSTGLTS